MDIDSLLRPVYGHAKQGASFGHTKIAVPAGAAPGAVPLATTICTPTGGAGDRRDPAPGRPGRVRPGRGAAWSPKRSTPPKPLAPQNILVRGDSAYGNGKVIAAARAGPVRSSRSC